MRLSALLSTLPPSLAPLDREGSDDPVIRGVAYDSRAVSPGDVFFALRGADHDGHAYLEQAIDLGAAALVVETLPPELDLRGATAVVVADTRRALAPVSTRFFGEPSSELTLIGVTGTNGKTSTTYLVESILAAAGQRTGLIGTVEVRFDDVRRRALNTTPESLDLQQTLRDMRTREVDAAVMEVSSHGLELGRVEGCRFDVAAFTNLTQDHLDFHGDMQAYLASKTRLFREHLSADSTGVVNLDDPVWEAFAEAGAAAGARILGVTRRADAEAEVRLESADVGLNGTRAGLRIGDDDVELALPLVGDFNVENLLVACGIARALGIASATIARGVEDCPQVPGRVERIGGELEKAPHVIVDYAHTPDAVEKLLATLRPLSRGRLIAVFGCGGDRDRAKRPLMAEAVARHADGIVATSDNPRTEDPEHILDDVVSGLAELTRVDPGALGRRGGTYVRLTDRREAIAAAIAVARPEDTVVIAGKGHEDYQIVGRDRLPFSDCDEALRALQGEVP